MITDEDKLKCLEREIGMRKSVYPRWVYAGKMTQDQADREIACMEAIADDYRRLVRPGLFDQEAKS
jgi:hypothetical protein